MEVKNGRVNRTELKWVILVSVVLFVLTSIPFFLGATLQDKQWDFSGFYFNVEDGNSYIAKMLNGSAGEWLFRTPYSVHTQKGFFAFFPYILLGKLASPPGLHEQLLVLFQFFRLVSGTVMFIGTYYFIAVFIDDVRSRRITSLIGVIGGGLGWLYFLGLESLWGGRIPLEFYSPETFGFLSFFSLPHLAMARGLLLISLRIFTLQTAGINPINRYFGGILLLIMGMFQPLTIMIGWAVIGSSLLVMLIERSYRKDPLEFKTIVRDYAGYFLIPSPLVIYSLIGFNIDPYLAGWASRNVILSPPILDYVLSIGVVLLLALVAVVVVTKNSYPKFRLLIIWLAIAPILVYFPMNMQRRLADGLWLVLIILVFTGLDRLPRKKVIQSILLAVSLISPILFLIGGINGTRTLQNPIYNQRSMITLVEIVGEELLPDDVIIADHSGSNLLPSYFNVRTVIGHGPESVNPGLDLGVMDRLFSGMENPYTQNFVCASGGTWLLIRLERLETPDLIKECCHIVAKNEEYLLLKIDQHYCDVAHD